MRYCPITAAQVQSRQQHVRECTNDSAVLTESAISISKDIGTKRYLIYNFFGECNNTETAEKCLPTLISFMNDNAGCIGLTDQFIYKIAPVIENTQRAFDMLRKLDNPETYRVCHEALEDMAAIDRMLQNHERISKRFNVNNYVIEHQFDDPEYVISNQLCEWIDTYSISPKHKYSIALEESAYLFGKSGIEYDSSKVIETITEYFLLSRMLDKNTVAKTLEENRFINTDHTWRVEYLFNEASSDDVQGVIDQCKTDDKFNDGRFKMAINKIYTKDAANIINDTPNILRWLRRMVVASTLGINVILGAVVAIADQYIQMKLDRKQTNRIIRNFNNEIAATKKAIEKESDDVKKADLQKYLDSLEEALSKINLYKDTLYTYDEISKQDDIELEAAHTSPISLTEFAGFQFDKISKIADDASNYIKMTYNKKPGKVQYKVTDKNIGEDIKEGFRSITSNFTKVLQESNSHIYDAVLATFDISEATTEEAYQFIESVTDDISNRYEKPPIRVYVNTSGDACEIHMADSTPIFMHESQMDDYGYFNAYEIGIIRDLLIVENQIEQYINTKPNTILKDLYESDLGFDEAYAILELYKYSGLLEGDEIFERVIDKYSHTGAVHENIEWVNENTKLNSLSFEFHEDLPFEVQLEACKTMRAILNEGIDMSSFKLALQGMKKKVQNLGTKEKEVSRDMDVAANSLMKSIENALTNDRREAIIKGSVIPSFSKCIKFLVANAGIAALLNPGCAAISCIGMLAGSKYLNDRERMLLLDEIEVELKVVEKEIQTAESDNDMQKYRKLLTYQKRLKKEDFKLRYHVSRKMGKDYITKKAEDDD